MPRLLVTSALLLAGAFLYTVPRPAGASEPNASSASTTIHGDAGAGTKSLAVPVPPASPEAMRHTTAAATCCGWSLRCWKSRFRVSGPSAAGRPGCGRWPSGLGDGRSAPITIYYVLFTLITFLVVLPLDYYAGFVRQHAYGMSNQSLSKWTTDT